MTWPFKLNSSETALEREIVTLTTNNAKTKWDGWFDNALYNLTEEGMTCPQIESAVKLARYLANRALEEYEDRWGKK